MGQHRQNNRQSVTHLAGNAVRVGDWCFQCCLICGEPLIHMHAPSVAVANVGAGIECDEPLNVGDHFIWPIGGWVRVEGNHWSWLHNTENPDFDITDLHPDCCYFDLVRRLREARSG